MIRYFLVLVKLATQNIMLSLLGRIKRDDRPIHHMLLSSLLKSSALNGLWIYWRAISCADGHDESSFGLKTSSGEEAEKITGKNQEIKGTDIERTNEKQSGEVPQLAEDSTKESEETDENYQNENLLKNRDRAQDYKTFGTFIFTWWPDTLLTESVFNQIHRHFETLQELTVFLAHSCWVTDGFQMLKPYDDLMDKEPNTDNYYSRGLIHCTTKDNYAICGQKYVDNPDLLASLDEEACAASLRLYSELVHKDLQNSIGDSWISLYPVEVHGHNYESVKYKVRIIGRLELYHDICDIYRQKPVYGIMTFFLPEERLRLELKNKENVSSSGETENEAKKDEKESLLDDKFASDAEFTGFDATLV